MLRWCASFDFKNFWKNFYWKRRLSGLWFQICGFPFTRSIPLWFYSFVLRNPVSIQQYWILHYVWRKFVLPSWSTCFYCLNNSLCFLNKAYIAVYQNDVHVLLYYLSNKNKLKNEISFQYTTAIVIDSRLFSI